MAARGIWTRIARAEAHWPSELKLPGDAFGYILGQSIASAHAGPEDMAKHSQLGQGSGGGMV